LVKGRSYHIPRKPRISLATILTASRGSILGPDLQRGQDNAEPASEEFATQDGRGVQLVISFDIRHMHYTYILSLFHRATLAARSSADPSRSSVVKLSSSSLMPSTVPWAYSPPFSWLALTIRVLRGVHISTPLGDGALGDRIPARDGDGHVELSEARLAWPRSTRGGVEGGEALRFGAAGGVTGRGGVVGGRGFLLGVAWISIGKAMNTSLPVGSSSDRERLIELAVMGAGAMADEVETASEVLGGAARSS